MQWSFPYHYRCFKCFTTYDEEPVDQTLGVVPALLVSLIVILELV